MLTLKSPLLNCRCLETSVNCSVKIEYDKIEWPEAIHCGLQLHGNRSLSPIFPIEVTQDGHIEMNFVFEDIGEIMAVDIELLPNKDDIGLNIHWIEIDIPKKKFLHRFKVERWLHSKMGDGRTRLILTPHMKPEYLKRNVLDNIEQPKRDYIKYVLLIEMLQSKDDADKSILAIDLIGKYGRTSQHPINVKYNKTVPLQTRSGSNVFELTMIDIGSLYECEISLKNKENHGSYYISAIYIYHRQYYEIKINQWIENDQTIKADIQLATTPMMSTFFNEVQLKSTLILWITSSDLIENEMTVPIRCEFHSQKQMVDLIEDILTVQPYTTSVLAFSTACAIPLTSILLGYQRNICSFCLAKEIVVFNVFQGQHLYFYFDEQLPKSINDMDFYSFIPKINILSPGAYQSTKQYIISISTSENNLSTKHTIKVVLRGERRLTTMFSLHNSSWNTVAFKTKSKDKFLLLAPDIGKITGLTMFHASEEAKYNFDIIEIFMPDTKSCIRLQGKHEIFNEMIDFSCHEPEVVYIVQIKSGFSSLNNTADVILTLIGEESSIEWILLTCDSNLKPFSTGQLDTFYIPSKNLGKIRAVNITCSNVDVDCEWFCETIYVHDTAYNIKSNYVINRRCGDHHEIDFTETSNTTSKASLLQPVSTKLLTSFLMTIKNGVRSLTNSNLTPSIYVYFAGSYGSSPIIHLNELTNKTDLFQSLEIDEFTFTIPDTGMPNIMRIWNVETLILWTCEYIDIKNMNNSKTVHFPVGVDLNMADSSSVPSYVDLEVDIGRITLALPGPRDDAAFPSYKLIIRTSDVAHAQDSTVCVLIKGEKNQSKLIPLTENVHDDLFQPHTTSEFLLYGICSLGELEEVSVHFEKNQADAKWICEYAIIYDYLNDKYYGTKNNTSVIYDKFKLSPMKNIDNHSWNHELDGNEIVLVDKRVQESEKPVYRILYKTQVSTFTNISSNAEVLIRLIGDTSTSFFPLEHHRRLLPGSIHEYFYRGNDPVNGLNKIDLQLIDNENSRWACESIEVQNLLNDDIVIFPINDVIEATINKDEIDKKIFTWKSGFKSGIVYFIQVRTGYQGASLNFRYGSVYLSLKIYGDAGVLNDIQLHVPSEQLCYLQSNQTDTFEIGQVTATVGQLSSIDLSHNAHKDDYWQISWIKIIDITTNKAFYFTVDKCLNKDLGINSKALHIPVDVSSIKSDESNSVPNYAMRVKTGAETPSHTEETSESTAVSIVFIDSLNDSVQIALKRMNNAVRSIFQPGQEDRFDITITPMLELKALQIYYHGTFSWFCERITITDQISGLSYRFDVDQWFKHSSNDNPVTIFAQREDDLGWLYSVTIKTQAVLPAQTNLKGKVILSIYGEKDSLNDAVLGSGRLMHGLFHAGGEDIIELKSVKRLGEIHSIELRLEVAEWQSWFCDIVEITDLSASWDFLSRTMITKTFKFPINRWLGAHAMDKRTMIRSSVNQEPGYAKMPTYIVHVLTGTKHMNVDSDAQLNVYLQLFCTISNNVYGPILLDKSSNNTQPFRKGQTDEFYVNDLNYCGEIKKVRLWHDGSKSWHCEWIKITNVHENEVYEFVVEKILDEDLEEGSSNLILYSATKDHTNESELATPQAITS